MTRKSRYPKTRYHVHIYIEDLEWLREFYGPGNPSGIGIGEAIAEIIHHRIKALRERQQREVEQEAQRGSSSAAATLAHTQAVKEELEDE